MLDQRRWSQNEASRNGNEKLNPKSGTKNDANRKGNDRN